MNRPRNLSLSEMAYPSSSSSSFYDSDSDSSSNSDDDKSKGSQPTLAETATSSSKIEIDKAFLEYLLQRGQQAAASQPPSVIAQAEKKHRSSSRPRSKAAKAKSISSAKSRESPKGERADFTESATKIGDANKEMSKVGISKLMEVGFGKDQSEAAMRIFGNYQDALDGLLSSKVESVSVGHDDNDARSTHSREAFSIPASENDRDVSASNTVWVGNVLPNIKDQELRDIFSNCGQIRNLRVLRPGNYAFIEYSSQAEAAKAISTLGGFSYKECKFIVRYTNSKHKPNPNSAQPNTRKMHNTIRINGVPTHVENQEIKDLFANAGPIKEIRFVRAEKRVFIEYNTPREAEAAVVQFNKFKFKTAEFEVDTVAHFPLDDLKQPTLASTSSAKAPEVPTYDLKQLWIGGLHPELSDREFINVLSKYGAIENYRFIRPKMCAFVTYETENAAQNIIENLQGHELRGLKLNIRYSLKTNHNAATPGSRSAEQNLSNASSSIWVGNVLPQITDLDLLQLFCENAKIKNYRVMRDWKCAFINYNTEEDATKTIRRLQGYDFKGCKLILDYVPQEGGKSVGKKYQERSAATQARTTTPNPEKPKSVCLGNLQPHIKEKLKKEKKHREKSSTQHKTDTRNPEQLKSICVGNLKPHIKEKHITELFSKCGTIVSCKLVPEHNCIFVNYTNSQEATRALQTFQNYGFRGTVLNLRFSKKGGVKSGRSGKAM